MNGDVREIGRQITENGETGFATGDGTSSVVGELEKYLDIARSNKLLIAGVIAAALVIGLIVTMLSTPQYTATTRIEISSAEQNVTNVEGVQSERVLADRSYLPTQYELLESRSLALRVIRELDLANDEAFLRAYKIEPEEVAEINRAIVQILFNDVTIAPISNSLLVDISYESPSASLSARIADAWADAYIAENLDRRFGATIEAREFLEDRLEQTRQRLEDAERAAISYAAQEGLVSVQTAGEGGDSNSTVSQTLLGSELQEFNRALQQATADRVAAEASLAARTGSGGATSREFASSGMVELERRRSELLVELAELRSRFEDGYPQVQALQAQIDEIDRVIASQTGAAVSRLRADYQEALAREQRLLARVNDLQEQFVSQRQDSVEYNILQREVDTSREIYAGLLQRYREIGVVGVGESNVVIVDEAQIPRNQSSPNLVLNMLAALLAGFFVVIGGIYVADLFNQSLRDPKQVKSRLGLTLLASIPRTEEEDIVEELSSSYSELYESYFSMASSIAFSAGGVLPRSIMVTSSRPGEGKSLTSVAMAYFFARQGKRVLLLDCDLRKSGISKYLDADNQTGVSQYLLGNDDWRSMVIQSAPLEGFSAIPAGRKPLSAAELLANGRFQKLLDETEAEFDHIVVDAPPVLGLVDSPLIASSLDGLVFVIEANEGKWRYIEGSVARLKESNANILGAVVTKLDDRNTMYGYGTGYGYGYGYGDRPEEDEGLPAR